MKIRAPFLATLATGCLALIAVPATAGAAPHAWACKQGYISFGSMNPQPTVWNGGTGSAQGSGMLSSCLDSGAPSQLWASNLYGSTSFTYTGIGCDDVTFDGSMGASSPSENVSFRYHAVLAGGVGTMTVTGLTNGSGQSGPDQTIPVSLGSPGPQVSYEYCDSGHQVLDFGAPAASGPAALLVP